VIRVICYSFYPPRSDALFSNDFEDLLDHITALARYNGLFEDYVGWSSCWSVSLLGATVSPAKMARPIEMPFGMVTWVGSTNYVLDRCAH